MIRKNWLLVLGILITVIIRAYFILNGSEVADVHTLFEMGDITLKGANPYLVLSYNSYPPLALYLEIVTIKLSQLLHIPFFMLIKVWPNLADLLTGLIIFWFLIKKGVSRYSASSWSLVFLLNPVSILISSAHGQLDSIPNLGVIIAILFLQFRLSTIKVLSSALTLGLAVAIKPNPLILVPIFLLYLSKRISFGEKLLFTVVALAPVAFLFLPFLINNYQDILVKLFNYSGSDDFGLSAPLKTLYFYHNATYQLPYADDLLKWSKWIFLTLLTLLMVYLRKSANLPKLVLLTYLLFLTVYFGISAHI